MPKLPGRGLPLMILGLRRRSAWNGPGPRPCWPNIRTDWGPMGLWEARCRCAAHPSALQRRVGRLLRQTAASMGGGADRFTWEPMSALGLTLSTPAAVSVDHGTTSHPRYGPLPAR